MNKEELKRKIISYIEELADVIPANLNEMSYEDVLSIYLSTLEITPKELESEIANAIYDYKEQYPDITADKETIIDTMGVFHPSNMIFFLETHIRELQAEIKQRKSSLESYKEQLEGDLADYEKSKIYPDDFNNFRLAELPSDISYDRYVVNNYPDIIAKLEDKLNYTIELRNKIQDLYIRDDSNLFMHH